MLQVKNGLDEWKTGVYSPIIFSEKVYGSYYEALLETLGTWRKLTDDSGTRTAAAYQVDLLRLCRYVNLLISWDWSWAHHSEHRASVGLVDDDCEVIPGNMQITHMDMLADEAVEATTP